MFTLRTLIVCVASLRLFGLRNLHQFDATGSKNSQHLLVFDHPLGIDCSQSSSLNLFLQFFCFSLHRSLCVYFYHGPTLITNCCFLKILQLNQGTQRSLICFLFYSILYFWLIATPKILTITINRHFSRLL